MFDDTKVQTFLTGHGGAEFQAYCDSVVPMYKQCLGTLYRQPLIFMCSEIVSLQEGSKLSCRTRRLLSNDLIAKHATYLGY